MGMACRGRRAALDFQLPISTALNLIAMHKAQQCCPSTGVAAPARAPTLAPAPPAGWGNGWCRQGLQLQHRCNTLCAMQRRRKKLHRTQLSLASRYRVATQLRRRKLAAPAARQVGRSPAAVQAAPAHAVTLAVQGCRGERHAWPVPVRSSPVLLAPPMAVKPGTHSCCRSARCTGGRCGSRLPGCCPRAGTPSGGPARSQMSECPDRHHPLWLAVSRTGQPAAQGPELWKRTKCRTAWHQSRAQHGKNWLLRAIASQRHVARQVGYGKGRQEAQGRYLGR